MKKFTDQGEDYRWYLDRPVTADDFNTINSVAIFAGPLLEMYPSVTREELKALLKKSGERVCLDAREAVEFNEAHIPGSVNIPVALIERYARDVFKKSDPIIVYGRSKDCALSAVAADKLATIGFEDVTRYAGGMEDWVSAGEPVEGAPRTVSETVSKAA
ncbi:MAG TPA: rhodanese-like domain-containing protein [Thermodesulfobacteriota bacterium]|nr:rhodanese-like domain-containing protein [Thermodesulfobacteriota bacterium]